MEIEKVEAKANEVALNQKSRVAIEKCHTQILALEEPKRPEISQIESIVVGPIKSKEAENTASLIGFMSSMGFALGTIGISSIFDVETSSVFVYSTTAIAFAFVINGMSVLFSKKKTLGYRVQRLWAKMGLPAKKLHALERKIVAENVAYARDMEFYQKRIRKIKKKVQPEIERINASNDEFIFSFGDHGLISSGKTSFIQLQEFKDLSRAIGE